MLINVVCLYLGIYETLILFFLVAPRHYSQVQFDQRVYVALVISHVGGDKGVFFCQLIEFGEHLKGLMAEIQGMVHIPSIEAPQVCVCELIFCKV